MDLLTINVSELILTILNFFLLMFLLKHFLYTPLITFMDARRARIDAGLKQEEEALAAVAEQKLRHEEQRRQSMEEAKRVLDESKAANAQRHAEMVARLKAQAAQERREAQCAAAQQNEEEKRQLEAHREELAALLAERLLHSSPAVEG